MKPSPPIAGSQINYPITGASSGRQAAEEKAAGLESEGAALGAREQAAPRPTAADQALEYARSAAGVAGQIQTLETDSDRVAAVKGAVSLARFGWELAEKAGAGKKSKSRRGASSTGRNGRCGLQLTGSKTPRPSERPSNPGKPSTMKA